MSARNKYSTTQHDMKHKESSY